MSNKSIKSSSSSSSSNSSSTIASNLAEDTPLLEQARQKSSLLDRLRNLFQTNYGFGLLIMFNIFAALATFTAKKAQHDIAISGWEILNTARFLLFIMYIIYIGTTKRDRPVLGTKGYRLWMLLRGVFIYAFNLFSYIAVGNIGMSIYAAVTFLTPIITTLFGYVLLKERCSIFDMLAALVSFGGVVLISLSQFGSDEDGGSADPNSKIVGVIFAAISVLCQSLAIIITRIISSNIEPSYGSMYTCSLSVISMIIFYGINPDFSFLLNYKAFLYALLLDLFIVTGMYFQLVGYRTEKAGRGSLALYVQLPMAVVMDTIFFRSELPGLISIVGTALIIVSSLLTVYIDYRSRKRNRA